MHLSTPFLNTEKAAKLLAAELLAAGGSTTHCVTHISPLLRATQTDLVFTDQAPAIDTCIAQFSNRQIGCLLLPKEALNSTLLERLLEHKIVFSYLVCRDVRVSFALLAQYLCAHTKTEDTRIHPTAIVHPSTILADGVCIGAYSVIGANCHIGQKTNIADHVSIGNQVVIGDNSQIETGAKLANDVVVGSRCHLYHGCVIGADGFGYAFDSRPKTLGAWIKIPQIGSVHLGDDVDIGANTTIDRGTMDHTIIEDGVKVDNQVQIGHNCHIGRHSIIAGCVGIAGSTVVGQRCRIGGAAMITGHLSIPDDTEISPASVIFSTIKTAGKYTGFFPFAQHHDWKKMSAMIRGLLNKRA